MAGKKRRKRRAHRARAAAVSRNNAPRALKAAQPRQAESDRAENAAREPPGTRRAAARTAPADLARERMERAPTRRLRTGLLSLPGAVLLPGQAFFAMGRPIPGLACYALQASLVGWLPAALWAVRAERDVAQKQRGLAARLRPL